MPVCFLWYKQRLLNCNGSCTFLSSFPSEKQLVEKLCHALIRWFSSRTHFAARGNNLRQQSVIALTFFQTPLQSLEDYPQIFQGRSGSFYNCAQYVCTFLIPHLDAWKLSLKNKLVKAEVNFKAIFPPFLDKRVFESFPDLIWKPHLRAICPRQIAKHELSKDHKKLLKTSGSSSIWNCFDFSCGWNRRC